MSDIPSTIKEPRFYANCKHCNHSFFNLTMTSLYKHLEEHEIGIHFSDIRVISKIIEKFEYTRDTCDEGFHDEKKFEEHKEEHCD